MAESKLPSTIILPDGKKLRLVLFAVTEKDANGKPLFLRSLAEDDNIKLSEHPEDNWFITGYIDEDFVR